MCDVGGANTENHKTKQNNNLTRGSGSNSQHTPGWPIRVAILDTESPICIKIETTCADIMS